MNKIFRKTAYLLILAILFINLNTVVTFGASPKIVSIKNLSITVKINHKYSLPKTVVATMSDKTVKNVSVIWNKKTLDTSKIGSYTFKGTVKGYTPKVVFTVKVIGEENKPSSLTNNVIPTPTPIPSTEIIYDNWGSKRDLPSVNQTKLSTCFYTGYSTITLVQPNNDVKKAVTYGTKIIYIHNDGKVKEYDPVLDSCSDKYEITDLRNSDGDFQLLAIGNLIYIIGVNFTDVLVYDPTNNQCTMKTKLPTKRRVGGVVSANSKIYILGGFDMSTGNTIKTLDEYDPSTDKWAIKANMKDYANNVVATALNDEIYILGSSNENTTGSGGKYTQDMKVYDIKNDKWNIKTSFADNRVMGETLEIVNGKIYAIGQKQDLKSDDYKFYIEEYDPKTNNWTSRATSISTERSKYASVVFNGEIYIIGGVKYKPIPQDQKESQKFYAEKKANPTSMYENIKTIEKYTPPKP